MMIPQTLVAFILFLVLAAPGVFFEILRQRRRPSWEQSAFREASRTALASLVFSLGSLLLLAIVRTIWPRLLPDLGEWIARGNKAYLIDHYRLVARFMIAEVAIALLLAFLANLAVLTANRWPTRVQGWWRRVHHSFGPMGPETAWQKAFRLDVPSGASPFVRVRLKDGPVYQGAVDGFSTDTSRDDRELALGPPLSRAGGNDERLSPLAGWQRVVVPASEIEVLWLTYVSKALVNQERSGDGKASSPLSADGDGRASGTGQAATAPISRGAT
jgi:Family of unknown function (DUF6338)